MSGAFRGVSYDITSLFSTVYKSNLFTLMVSRTGKLKSAINTVRSFITWYFLQVRIIMFNSE